jgi:hypothetical protein
MHTSPRLQNVSICGRAQAFSKITINRPHVVETGLDATCSAMALTSCFAKIGTFYNVEGSCFLPTWHATRSMYFLLAI